MSHTKPRESASPAPGTGSGTPSPAPTRSADATLRPDAPVVWPRDMNTPTTTKDSVWGSDPDGLHDA